MKKAVLRKLIKEREEIVKPVEKKEIKETKKKKSDK